MGENNSKLAGIFYEMADIYELRQVRWKPQAYRIAAQTMESLKQDVSEIYKKQGLKGLDSLPGIGSGIAGKIEQFLKTGKIQEYEKLKKSLPSGLYSMMNIPGVGPKRASLFYYRLGIKSVKELKQAAKKGKLIGLPGFKARAEEKILEGIGIFARQKGRIPLKQAEEIAEPIIKELKKLPEVKKAEFAGSLRRKKPTIRDIDIVIKTKKPKSVIDRFTKMRFVSKVLAKGADKAIIITKSGIQVDIRPFPPKSYGSGLLYFTGDKNHNIWLRKKAIRLGWKLNEYGLFDKKTGKQIAGKTEKEIYEKLKVKMINPELRMGEVQ